MNLTIEEKKNILKLAKETGMNITKCSEAWEKYPNFDQAKEFLSHSLKDFSAKGEEIRVEILLSDDQKTLAQVFLSAATPFVCENSEFKDISQEFCQELLNTGTISEQEKRLKLLSNKFGETIFLENTEILKTNDFFSFYLHHTKKQAVIIEYTAENPVNLLDICVTALVLQCFDIEKILKECNIITDQPISEFLAQKQTVLKEVKSIIL